MGKQATPSTDRTHLAARGHVKDPRAERRENFA